jgi:phosphoribosyl-dephospho-CoA transferase
LFTLNYVGGIKAKDKWNKIYFNIGALNSTVGADAYQIIIRSSLNVGAKTGYVALDNFKLIGPKP